PGPPPELRADPSRRERDVLIASGSSHVFLQDLRCGLADVDIAHRIGSDAFHAGVIVLVWFGFDERDQCRDLAVLCAADSKASLEPWIEAGVRLRIHDVDRVVLIDGNAAGPAELLPLVEELSVLVEN